MSSKAEVGPAVQRVRSLSPSLVGKIAYYLLPLRRREILSNIHQVFGDELSKKEARRLAQSFYSHFWRLLGEIISAIWTPKETLASRVDVEGIEHVLKAAENGKGVLVLTGHFGNWEMAAVAAMMQFQKYQQRIHVVRKNVGWIAGRFVFNWFESAGINVLSRVGALERILEILENNEVAILVMDQHAPPPSKGVPIEFFGKKAWTNRSLALLAGKTGAAVIPAVTFRKPDGRHYLRFEKALEWIEADSTKAEELLNTRRYSEVLERFVLEQPEQWFWVHRRWKKVGGL